MTGATVLLLPFAGTMLGPTLGFLPAVLMAVLCFDVISLYLLAGEFRDSGDRRILVTAWAYVLSLVAMLGYALAFPGVFSTEPPLASVPSVAPYLYILWHTGFPVLLGLAWAPWPARLTGSVQPSSRSRLLTVTLTAVGLVSVAAATACVTLADRWPVLIDGLDTSRMTTVTAPITLPLVLVSLILAREGLKHRTGPEKWIVLAVLVCICDLVLTYAASSRYSVGWYVGRGLTMVAAAALLIGMLASFRAMKSRAEFHAAFDGLTGLANRRNAHEILDRMIARANRATAPLSVIAIDIDHFKRINDKLGHAAGDTVLAAVGRQLTESVRSGDVPARVGGEEFLVLLPDTGLVEAHHVAERIRAALECLDIAVADRPVTASLGVAENRAGEGTAVDLLLRADQALYTAKRNGRNRVEGAAMPVRVRTRV